MITKDNLRQVLEKLGFAQENGVYRKHYDSVDCDLKVDFNSEKIEYPTSKDFVVNERQTCNLSDPENFVVLECVNRLFEKGYQPNHIELEPRWKLGHNAKSGRADIWVRTYKKVDNKETDEKQSLLIIECKTAGTEFNGAWKDTLEDGAQLFSYFQQEQATKFLCLYTSDFVDEQIKSEYHLINVQDNTELINTLKDPKTYKDSKNNKELFSTWKETYQQDSATRGLFETDIAAYNIGKNNYSVTDLEEITSESMQKKYNEFATILRQHNVSGHENAFDKLVNLFLAKVVDETSNPNSLDFYWKGAAYDDFFRLQDRLQKLYKIGMEKFLGEDVTYIDNKEVEAAFRLFKNDPDATKKTILEYFRQLKFFTNNDFAFIDVHNEHLFYQNSAVLLKIVKMLQDIKLKTNTQNQFLGDLFEGFLDQGVKQSEGQFFTPTPIVKFLVSSLPLEQLINDTEIPQVIDYACGAGHFLNEYAEQIKPLVTKKNGNIADYYGAITGIEKEYRLSKVSKVASFMYGQDDIRIIYADALSNIKGLNNNSFSVLVANPPYSVKGFLETLTDDERSKFELTAEVSDIARNNSIETFFVERAAQLLKIGGVAAIILPSSVLSNGNIYIKCREILLQHFDIVAIAEFGSGTFGKTGTNTVTLFLRRKAVNPSLAEHYKNRVESWFNRDETKDDVFKDYPLLEKYCEHIGVPLNIYKTLFETSIENVAGYELSEGSMLKAAKGVGFTKSIYDYEIFREYKTIFSNDTTARAINRKRITTKYTELDKAADLSKHIKQSIIEIEKDKLYYFMLAKSNPQPVIVVKAPAENKANKQFLGYEWSDAKGSEGIKYLGATVSNDEDNELERNKGIKRINTPLFNPNNLDDAGKINSVIRQNFIDGKPIIPEHLKEFVSDHNLVDMLDFSRTSFDKQIKTNISKKVEVVSKYELVKLGEYLSECDKSKIQVGIAKDVIDGQYPFFTSGEQVLSFDSFLVDGENIYLSTGGNAVVKFYDGKASYSTDTWVIRSNNPQKLLTKYLYLILSDIQKEINDLYFKGVGLKHLQKGDLKSRKIPLPPLEIQQQIVAECNDIDTEYEQAKRIAAECKQSIVDFIKDVQGSLIKIGELGRICMCKRIMKHETNTLEGIPFFKIGTFGGTPNAFISPELFQKYKDAYPYPKNGQILISAAGTLGKTVVFDGNPAYFQDSNIVWIDNDEKIATNKFVYYALKGVNWKNYSTEGSVIPRIYNDKLKSVVITVPSIEEQQKIVAQITVIESDIQKAKDIMAHSAELKTAVLQKYL